MEDIDVKINEDGSVNVIITDTQEDGANAVNDAIHSLKRAVSNYKGQIRQLEENIKSNHEAIKHVKENVGYSNKKIQVFEETLIQLKDRGFKPTEVELPKENENKGKN